MLSADEIRHVGGGDLKVDVLVRLYVHANTTYRVIELPDGATAETTERRIRREGLQGARPLLNP